MQLLKSALLIVFFCVIFKEVLLQEILNKKFSDGYYSSSDFLLSIIVCKLTRISFCLDHQSYLKNFFSVHSLPTPLKIQRHLCGLSIGIFLQVCISKILLQTINRVDCILFYGQFEMKSEDTFLYGYSALIC